MQTLKFFVFLILAVNVAWSRRVICYYGAWATYRQGNGNFEVDNIDPFLCTHAIYSFAGIDNWGNIIALDPWLDLPDNWGRNNYGRFTALKQRNPNLRTLLAVGGWSEGSAKYSIMAANPGYRANFINSAIRIMWQHGFDGLDIDWEYPNQRDTVHGWADVDNFTRLVRELREAFDRQGRHFILSAAVPSVRASASLSYDIPAISRYLDIVNIMTYDMAGSWDPVTGHNAPLHRPTGVWAPEQDLFTVEQAVWYWINQGCPRDKIAVGVPFYGRTFRLQNGNNNGVGAPAAGPGIGGPYTGEGGYMGYNEVCHKFRTEHWNLRYDHQARVPYAFSNNDWLTYDDADSIQIKVHFARNLGINSIMIWSIETDDFRGICGGGTYPLLRSVNNSLRSGIVDYSVPAEANASDVIQSAPAESDTSDVNQSAPAEPITLDVIQSAIAEPDTSSK